MSNDIKDKIDLIAEESITKISKSESLNELEELRIFYLGKKGLITSFLKTMKVLEQSKKIQIGKKLNLLKNKLIQLTKSNGSNKLIELINVLGMLSEEKSFKYLASESFNMGFNSKDKERTQLIIDYITQNYNENIKLKDLASLAHMTTNSFCRFFKENTGSSAFSFLREYRINKACQLLINTDQKISQICYSTGFNSVSTFNRIFKIVKGLSASEFRIRYHQYIS